LSAIWKKSGLEAPMRKTYEQQLRVLKEWRDP
jgi:hypothetical protein